MKLSNRAYDIIKAISLTAGYILTFVTGILAVVLPTDTGKFVVAIVTAVIGGAGNRCSVCRIKRRAGREGRGRRCSRMT